MSTFLDNWDHLWAGGGGGHRMSAVLSRKFEFLVQFDCSSLHFCMNLVAIWEHWFLEGLEGGPVQVLRRLLSCGFKAWKKQSQNRKFANGRPSTCGRHVGVARVGGVVPLQWMMRYRACWEVGPWVRVTWLCDLVKSDSHFAIVIHSWMAVLIHSWMVLLMIFWQAWCSTTQSPTWPTRVVAPPPRVSWLGFYLPGVESENKNRGQNCSFVEVDAILRLIWSYWECMWRLFFTWKMASWERENIEIAIAMLATMSKNRRSSPSPEKFEFHWRRFLCVKKYDF